MSAVAGEFLPAVAGPWEGRRRARGCERTRAILPEAEAATEKDWHEEYLDLILAVRVVDGLDEAIAHIEQYGSLHTESIVTRDYETRSGSSERSIPRRSSSTPQPVSATAFSSVSAPRSASARRSCTPSGPWASKS